MTVLDDLRTDQSRYETHGDPVCADLLATDQAAHEVHSGPVGGDLLDPAIDTALPIPVPPGPPSCPVGNGWMELRIWAEMYNDAQLARIAATNRLSSETVSPDLYDAYIDSVKRSEALAENGLIHCYGRVVPIPILEWQLDARGLGPTSVGRLLGHLGHPRIATPYQWHTGKAPAGHECLVNSRGQRIHCKDGRHLIADEPYERTIAQLWQYCGHGDPLRSKPRKGMSAEELAAMGSPMLKKLVFLLAGNTMKQKATPGRYRHVYDTRRLGTEDRLHASPCVRCGPSGKPAVEGSPWSKKHQLADALRIVGKEILRDLWIVAGGGANAPTQPIHRAPALGDLPEAAGAS